MTGGVPEGGAPDGGVPDMDSGDPEPLAKLPFPGPPEIDGVPERVPCGIIEPEGIAPEGFEPEGKLEDA